MSKNRRSYFSENKSKAKHLAATKAIITLLGEGKAVTFQSVAKKANVSRQFLYTQPELSQKIKDCRVSTMTKQELQQEVVKLRFKVRELEAEICKMRKGEYENPKI